MNADNPFLAPDTDAQLDRERVDPGNVRYAGFWLRLVAFIIDSILIRIIIIPLAIVIGLVLGDRPEAELLGGLLGILLGWLYMAGFESSNMQASPGKKLLGLQVTDERGMRIGFGRATGRHFGKIISSLILFIGYIMAAFTQKKQALHDIMASCLVIRSR